MLFGMEVVQDARDANEAKYLCNQVVTLVEKDYGPNDLSLFHALSAHGVVCFRLGLLAEAEESFRRVYHRREAILCLDHGDTLEAAYDLATVLGLRGRYDLAEQLFKHALTGQEKLYGRTNMKVLDTVLGLAWLYNKQGRVQEAESLYERCLEGAERWLGPTQFDTLRVVRILARFYFEQERYSEAAALYERALAGERQQRRVNNVRSLKLTHNIGVVYNRQQRHEEAETKFLEALNGSDGILARSYPDTLEYVDEEPSLRTDRIDLDDWERTYIDQWTRHRFSSGEDVEERVVEADGA
jgi:tetratricopeptide (TPR) repeat protein